MRLLLFTILLFVVQTVESKELNLVSIEHLAEQRIGAMIIPKVYEKLGITVNITPLPGRRAQYQASSGLSDGEIMRIYSYGGETANVIRVPTPYFHLETMVFTKLARQIKVDSKEDLKHYTIVKVRGVKHTNNIALGLQKVSDASNTLEMLKLLNQELADVGLTNTIDGLLAIRKSKLAKVIAPNPLPLATLELYHYLHARHKNLVPQVDSIIKQMKQSGELTTLIADAKSQVLNSH